LPNAAQGLTHLSLNFHQLGQDSRAVRRSMRLFATELMVRSSSGREGNRHRQRE
jgi:hypothetical protein